MPRTATRIAEALLPAIFQRRPNGQIPGGLDPRTGAIWEGPHDANPNMLAPTSDVLAQPPISTYEMGDQPKVLTLANRDAITRPRTAVQPIIQPEPTNMLAPQNPDVYGQPSPSGQIMDENAIRDRRVETNRQGRPTPNITMQGDEQTLDYQNRLATMPADKAGGGWWPSIRAAIGGFAAGGPVGAAAAFGTRKLREHFDPELGSREYKAQEMSRNAPAVETIRQNRKDARADKATDAATDLAKARTDALKNPKAANIRLVSRKDGVYAVDPATMKAKKVDEIPAEPGSPASARFFSTDYGVYKIDEQHPNGVLVPGIPGKKGKDVEDVTFGNQQIQRAISEAQAEQSKIDEGLVGIPRTVEGTDPLTGVKKMVANPDYTYNMTRRRQLDDDIRNWRIKLKSAKKPAISKEDDPLDILGDDDE